MVSKLSTFAIFAALLGIINCQTYFTLPNNAWRVTIAGSASSGKWVGHKDYSGIGPQFFYLKDYGRQYYDHLHPDAYYDLHHLDSLTISTTIYGDLIRDFNNSASAAVWGDTLPDLSTVFFGPDSVIIGGYFRNTKYSRVIKQQTFKLEYGVSNRVTFSAEIPYIKKLEERRQWLWEGSTVPGLAEFVTYHDSARVQFADFAEFFQAFPMNPDTLSMLLTIKDRIYSDDGMNSVNQVLAGGNDPLANAIFGPRYNPFSASEDSATTIDELLEWYLPKYRSTAGLGDISFNLTYLLAGKPVWSRQSFYSVYAQFGLQLPLGKKLSQFTGSNYDSNNRPLQFSDLAIGASVTKWSLAFFGEFYRNIAGRFVSINWQTGIGIKTREFMNFPVSMFGTNLTHPDSIIAQFGTEFGYQPGWEWQGAISGNLEIWPARLWVCPAFAFYFKVRDKFYSVNGEWAEYMQFRRYQDDIVFDTRILQATPSLKIIFRNLHPLKKIGPIPFEFVVGIARPIFTRHSFSDFAVTAAMTTYFQAW